VWDAKLEYVESTYGNSAPDLLYRGQPITADPYWPLETFTVVAVIYFLLLFPMTLLAQEDERR
jgi:polar amino acid transport system permease protein